MFTFFPTFQNKSKTELYDLFKNDWFNLPKKCVKTDSYPTPRFFLDIILPILEWDRENAIDVCCNEENHIPECKYYITKEQNSLLQPWDHKFIWAPLPYSNKGLFLQKAVEEHLKNPEKLIVVIVGYRNNKKLMCIAHNFADYFKECGRLTSPEWPTPVGKNH